jgi:hypothetical protein
MLNRPTNQSRSEAGGKEKINLFFFAKVSDGDNAVVYPVV